MENIIDATWEAKVSELFRMPLLKLIQEAAKVHAENWPEGDIQRCSLLSIKTGHCPEDCSYCPQSARYATDIEKHPLLPVDEIVAKAREAKEGGSSRFCMGAAWRKPPRGEQFERVLTAIKEVKGMGLEVCATLGLLNDEQAIARRLQSQRRHLTRLLFESHHNAEIRRPRGHPLFRAQGGDAGVLWRHHWHGGK
jgi:biotin synthase